MTQIAMFVTLMVGAERFEVYVASFSPISTYSFALLVAQAPRSPKQAIFVRTTTDDCFTPCACARGNNWSGLTGPTPTAMSGPAVDTE